MSQKERRNGTKNKKVSYLESDSIRVRAALLISATPSPNNSIPNIHIAFGTPKCRLIRGTTKKSMAYPKLPAT